MSDTGTYAKISSAEVEADPNVGICILPLTALLESKSNGRSHDPAKLAELTESIKAKGVLNPLLIRRTEGNWEIVAGHRRFHAAAAAGLVEVPCRVLELTDSEAREVQIVENLQREDLHPLEEAHGYTEFLRRHGGDIKTLAARVGKTEAYIVRRMNLVGLIEPAQKACLAGKFGVEVAFMLSRIQPEQQKEVLNRFKRDIDIGGMTVTALKGWIESEVMLDLHSVAFDKDDLTLCPEAADCTSCPKRTGFSKLLFNDITKKDLCTDPKCFKAKLKEHIAREEDRVAKETGEAPVLLSDSYGAYNLDKETKAAKPLLKSQWEPAKKTDKDAKPGIMLDGSERGKVVYFKPDQGRVENVISAEDRANRKSEREEFRLQACIEQHQLKAVLNALQKQVLDRDSGLEDVRHIADMAWGWLGHDGQRRWCQFMDWEAPKNKGFSGKDFHAAGEAKIKAMPGSELACFLLGIFLMGRYAQKPHLMDLPNLKIAAERHGVDLAKIATNVKAEVKADKAKKAKTLAKGELEAAPATFSSAMKDTGRETRRGVAISKSAAKRSPAQPKKRKKVDSVKKVFKAIQKKSRKAANKKTKAKRK